MLTQQNPLLERVAAFVQSNFPGQFLIPVAGFSKLAGKTYGGARNDIARGAFPVPLIRQGGRNYVAIPDVIDYLASVWSGSPIKQADADPLNGKRRVGAPEKNPAAKTRAATAREARRAKRTAAVSQQAGGAA